MSRFSFRSAAPPGFAGVPHFLLAPEPAAEGLYADERAPGGARGDAGVDLRFPADTEFAGDPARVVMVDLAVRARAVEPEGAFSEAPAGGEGAARAHAFRIVARSSIARTPLLLANGEGIVDAGYLGTLRVAVRAFAPYRAARGEALFQLVSRTLEPCAVRVVAPDSAEWRAAAPRGRDAARGEGGFGSTGP